MTAPHTDLVRECLLYLSPLGLAWPNQSGALPGENGRLIRFGLPGSSDILACIRGRFVGVECKTGAAAQRRNQRNFEAAVARAGGLYILARSVADVAERLTAEGLA